LNNSQQLSFISSYCQNAASVTAALAKQQDTILSIVDALYKVLKAGGRIYTCGNGGSACDAMHLAEELVARYLRERPGIRSQHLIDSGTMTCWANDYNFDSVFSRQVETLMDPRDALVGFTTSGNSRNIIKAIESANRIGGTAIALTGKDGGQIKDLTPFCLVVQSELTSHIQQAHMALVHIFCDLLEQRLFPNAR
jgi:D-sedoheptulose 7-phosphate isomerase